MKHTFKFVGCLFMLLVIVTVAYAADQAINARTELAAAPAENDILPIYDTDATAGKRITVLNLVKVLESALTSFAIHADNLPDLSATYGDVTGVGDCASGACLDGSSDGGTYVRLYDGNSHYTQLSPGDSTANLTFTFPTAYPAASGYLMLMSDAGVISTTATLTGLNFGGFSTTAGTAVVSDGSGYLSQTITAFLPDAADGATLGSAAAEWSDLYLADGGVIYFQNDQSVYLTPSAGTLTLTGDFSATGDVTVTGADITLAAAGVKLTGSNGSLTILGLGDGQDEDIKIDLNTTANTIEITSPASSATAIDINTLNMVSTGYVAAAINIISDNDDHTVSTTEAYGGFGVAGGAGTWTLPAAAVGMSFCVYSTTAAAINVDVDASDVITLNGTALSAGDKITSASAAGDFICLVAVSTSSWLTLGRSGTWTDGN